MNLEGIKLSERNQTGKYAMSYNYMWNLKNKTKQLVKRVES